MNTTIGSWIAVEDRLPPAMFGRWSADVLVVTPAGLIRIDAYRHPGVGRWPGGEWRLHSYPVTVRPTHWMPLPEPPLKQPTDFAAVLKVAG